MEAEWMSRAVEAADLRFEVSFPLARTVYVGDPNDSSKFKDPEYNPEVELPAFPRKDPHWATSTEALGCEPQLVEYYRRAIARLSASPNSGHFWLRFELRSDIQQASIAFPWSDNLSQMSDVFAWLRGEDASPEYWDGDQGWEFTAVRSDDRLYFRHGDLGEDPEYAVLWVDKLGFDSHFADFEGRAYPLIRRLAEAIPLKFWL